MLRIKQTALIVAFVYLLIVLITSLYVKESWLDNGGFKGGRDELQLSQTKSFETRKYTSPVVILTYMRSGSSFVGDILQQNNDVFYLFEPLRVPANHYKTKHTYLSLNGHNRLYNTFLDAGEDIFRNWTKCNLFDLPDIAWREAFLLLGRKTKLFNECKENLARNQNQLLNITLYHCVKMLQKVCLLSKHVVIKTIRFPLYKLEHLMTEFPTMKILHLVRDPRATLFSRFKMDAKINVKSFTPVVTDFCSRVHRDLLAMDMFANKFKGRISTFRYEDIAKNPLNMAKSLYEFAGITHTPEVSSHVYNITMTGNKTDCGKICTVKSNSTATAIHWRSQITLEHAQLIDFVCRPVYKRLGFKNVENEIMLRNNSIDLRFEHNTLNDYRSNYLD